MSRFASVVAKSPLIQLDRSFDYIVPDEFLDVIAVGQEVIFPLGRSKKPQVGFVTQVMEASEHATTELLSISDDSEVLPDSLERLLRMVADRQCVAMGELLSLAVPDHMPTRSEGQPSKPQAGWLVRGRSYDG